MTPLRIRVWDFFAWLLIGFPLLTGGFWVQSRGLKFELSELAIPVLITALLAVVLTTGRRGEILQANSIRASLWVWERWNQVLKTTPHRTLLIASTAVAVLWTAVSWRRHAAFGSGAADLGIFSNALWNLTHGNGYVSSVKDGINLFQDHQSPLFWLLAPIYKIWPDPRALLLIQAVGLSLGGVAVWKLVKQNPNPKPWTLAAAPLLYWGYLPLRNANAFDFHPETLMLPLFLASIAGLQSTRVRYNILGSVFLILALAAKESAGLVALGIGFAWIMGAGPKTHKLKLRLMGGIVLCIGALVFYFDTHWVVSQFKGTYVYAANYSHLGASISEILLAPFKTPGIIIEHLLQKERVLFVFWMFAPLAFLPLLGGWTLSAAIPGFAIVLLTAGTHRVNLNYHYSIEPAVGLFWALSAGLGRASEIRWRPPALAIWIVFFALASHGRSEIARWRHWPINDHHHWLTEQLIPILAPEVSISASGALVPHLASRPWIHHLPKILRPSGDLVDCVVRDSAIKQWPLTDAEDQALGEELRRLGYRIELTCGPTQVLSRAGLGKPCIQEIPNCPSR